MARTEKLAQLAERGKVVGIVIAIATVAGDGSQSPGEGVPTWETGVIAEVVKREVERELEAERAVRARLGNTNAGKAGQESAYSFHLYINLDRTYLGVPGRRSVSAMTPRRVLPIPKVPSSYYPSATISSTHERQETHR